MLQQVMAHAGDLEKRYASAIVPMINTSCNVIQAGTLIATVNLYEEELRRGPKRSIEVQMAGLYCELFRGKSQTTK